MSCPVISPTLYVLQTLPSGQMICPAPVISPALSRTATPAQWVNYMPMQRVISPELHVLQTLPIGKILRPTPVISSTLYGAQTLPIGESICPTW